MGKKIFIGLCDIASFIDDWDYGFKANGCYTLKGSLNYQYPIQSSKLDFIIKKAQDKVCYFKPGRISVKLKPWWDKQVKNYYFRKCVKECDTFVFFWDTFNPDKSDFKILKANGKKIITIFVGDDIRWQPAMQQEFRRYNLPIVEYKDYDYSCSALNAKLQFLRTAEKYADLIFSQPNTSQLALKPYHNILIPIITKNYIENNTQRKIPIIIHAPTSFGKGTRYIEPVIKKLEDNGFRFSYQKIENVPRVKALEMYQNADIVIDQLLTPGGGKLAHECLAMGKVVLTLMADNKYDQKKPAECPLVDVSAEILFDVLKDLILDVSKREKIAKEGRPYIEKYHNPLTICKQLLQRINAPVEEQKLDFYPTFFRDKFIPESKEHATIYNKWTNTVKDCKWYKKQIHAGERDGLVF